MTTDCFVAGLEFAVVRCGFVCFGSVWCICGNYLLADRQSSRGVSMQAWFALSACHVCND